MSNPTGPQVHIPAFTSHVVQPDAPASPVNAYSVISLFAGVFGFTFVGAIVAVVFGHLAFEQINGGSRERGKALALTGLILGYASFAAAALTVVVVLLAWHLIANISR